MIELLAIPAYQTGPTRLDDWVAGLSGGDAYVVEVDRDGPSEAWVELTALRIRGYVVLAGDQVEAINFELHAVDPAPARSHLEAVAASIGWELHEDDEGDDDG